MVTCHGSHVPSVRPIMIAGRESVRVRREPDLVSGRFENEVVERAGLPRDHAVLSNIFPRSVLLLFLL